MEENVESVVPVFLTAGQLISSLGSSPEDNFTAIRKGITGIELLSVKKGWPQPVKGGAINPDVLSRQALTASLSEYTPLEQLFILCLRRVIEETGIDPAECGLILSTTKGNIELLNTGDDRIYLHRSGERIAEYLSIKTTPVILSTACISGVSALITASRLIQAGQYRHILVAGGDLLSPFVLSGFQSFKSISSEACVPYDIRRDGLTLGEACGALLVTTDPTKVTERFPVRLAGGAISNDANHISGPSRTGEGLFLAIRRAMNQANMEAGDISFINAHGTGTPYNDEMESKAFRLANLDNKPLNSLKPYWGHTLGASGVIETIACINQLQEQEVYGIPGYWENGVSCPLNIDSQTRKFPLHTGLKTASGFGGCNAAIVLTTQPVKVRKRPFSSILTKHTCTIHSGSIHVDGEPVFEDTNPDNFAQFIRNAYKHLSLDDRKFYKMDDLCKLGYVAAAVLLSRTDRSGWQEEETGIILANRSSSMESDLKHQEIIDTLGMQEASPAVFVYTLPNVVMGEICIRHHIKGENTFFISGSYPKEWVKEYSAVAMRQQDMKGCITGWCELSGGQYEAIFEWNEQIN